MSRKRTSFFLKLETLEKLNKLSKKHNRSMANMLEQLIDDASK